MKYLLICLLLVGCATDGKTQYQRRTDRIVGADKPIEYKQGFAQGCEAGEGAAGAWYKQYKKDLERFKTDELYKTGWNDGYDYCKARYQQLLRDMR